MRKAILPLLIILTMVLSASVASATDYSGSGEITDENGWATDGGWVNSLDEGVGLTTEGTAYASHAVATGAEGVFEYKVGVQLNSVENEALIGIITDTGARYTLHYSGGNLYLNGGELPEPAAFDAGASTYFTLKSEDGANVNYDIGQYNGAFPANGHPVKIEISLSKNAEVSPMIYYLSYTSPGEPAVHALPDPTFDIDMAKLQDYYDNIYPILFGQGANTGLTPASPSGYTVSGTVTGAADGNPVAGASVVLGNAVQKTDSLGKFKFEGLTSGITDIAVSADGFASQTKSVNVNLDQVLNFALAKTAAGGSSIASAANETANVTTNVTMPANATVAPTSMPATNNTTTPPATQTKSPGFEGILAAIAMIGAAGVLVYVNRKR